MTPIIGQVDLLLTGIRQGRDSLSEIESRLQRLQHAIHRYMKRATILLNVSRITSGKLQLEMEDVDLGSLLREVAEDFREAARRAGVPLRLRLPGGLSGTWDRLALEQIVDNLISNALKYGGRTPIEISAEQYGQWIRMQVRDHGAGIAPHDRQRVFQRFERATERGDNGGFGVGLWVVGQLTEAMGGSVEVDDAPGGGARFTVTLPRHAKELRSE
jgi:signal transduction histidine kinase